MVIGREIGHILAFNSPYHQNGARLILNTNRKGETMEGPKAPARRGYAKRRKDEGRRGISGSEECALPSVGIRACPRKKMKFYIQSVYLSAFWRRWLIFGDF